MQLLTAFQQALRKTAVFNPESVVAPACILWPDHARLWHPVIDRLQAEMPELLVLGDYAPDKRRGPAIWLRCAIAGTLDDVAIEPGTTPILYLPGVSRQDLRAVSDCPDTLKPLAELQYRGTVWTQENHKDWTPRAFLVSKNGGLKLDIDAGTATQKALQAALPALLDQPVESLRGQRLDADNFNNLLTGGDATRDLLQWLDDPEVARANRSESQWHALVQLSRSRFNFDPSKQSVLDGALALTQRNGSWAHVWDRYSEAPRRYPGIASRLRQLTMPEFGLFPGEDEVAVWPQWNTREENTLHTALCALSSQPAHAAREQLVKLEAEHGRRRDWLWADLDEAPLAMALGPLRILAQITTSNLAGGTADDMHRAYINGDWRADDSVLRALAHVRSDKDRDAVFRAIRAVYTDWAEAAARHLQKTWRPSVDGLRRGTPSPNAAANECVLFVDGLRFDCGKRLAHRLGAGGLSVDEHATWAALPSVTGTGKYAVAPFLNDPDVKEEHGDYQFSPITHHLFKKMLREQGWQVLDRHQVQQLHNESLDTTRPAWCEFGDIDHAGHERGWKLARYIDEMLGEIEERIQALLDQGWAQVRVVTDHGWLLLPGGLPKTELPAALAVSKWGRCAQIKPGAQTDYARFPWYWSEQVHFALAESIRCFKDGQEYTHGGLSLQECVTPELVVTAGAARNSTTQLTDLVWKGLRCTVVAEGATSGLIMDLRQQAGDAATSVAVAAKPFRESGKASVVVEDDDLMGAHAVVVICDAQGRVLAQRSTAIGGDD